MTPFAPPNIKPSKSVFNFRPWNIPQTTSPIQTFPTGANQDISDPAIIERFLAGPKNDSRYHFQPDVSLSPNSIAPFSSAIKNMAGPTACKNSATQTPTVPQRGLSQHSRTSFADKSIMQEAREKKRKSVRRQTWSPRRTRKTGQKETLRSRLKRKPRSCQHVKFQVLSSPSPLPLRSLVQHTWRPQLCPSPLMYNSECTLSAFRTSTPLHHSHGIAPGSTPVLPLALIRLASIGSLARLTNMQRTSLQRFQPSRNSRRRSNSKRAVTNIQRRSKSKGLVVYQSLEMTLQLVPYHRV
jgi:hypothetical protein